MSSTETDLMFEYFQIASQYIGQQFNAGKRVMNFHNNKKGTIDYLRDDTHEQTKNHPDNVYFYSISYDDGTSDTYESQSSLVAIN